LVIAVAALAFAVSPNISPVPFAYAGMALFTFSYLTLVTTLRDRRVEVRGWLLAIVTMVFGMVHGFGFAGFLLESGLTRSHILAPLLGFNVGVELGQLAAVAAIVAAAAALRRVLSGTFQNSSENLPTAAHPSALCALG